MALIGLKEAHYRIGGVTLLDGVSLQIEEGERLCVVGRNGAGKSTLLKILAGELTVDRGELSRKQNLKWGYLHQEILSDLPVTALEAALPDRKTESEDWEVRLDAERILTRLGVDPQAAFTSLSGGNKRRVLLARTLADAPDLLLLDEPTNHLDVETIEWLEDELSIQKAAVVFVTHDRTFARKIANRVAEVDRGKLYAFTCRYDEFQVRRAEQLEIEEAQRAQFEKKLAEEEAWVRRGVKARLKRNEGRVKALIQMRKQWAERRLRQGTANIAVHAAERSGDLICEVENVDFAYPGKSVLSNFSTRIARQDRVGIIGPNGSGKTTLLKVLLGQLVPQKGNVRLGTGLQVLYFDQMRSQIDLTKSVQENVGEGYDTVVLNGKSQHILGYLDHFLFTPERARVPASILSGGERNRLLLAKLFTKPSNVLVLDEPTNDLDTETLDLLEDLLVEYPGTILLVSHDRDFLDNVVTSTLAFNPDGSILENAGGWSDWEAHRKRLASEQTVRSEIIKPTASTKEKPKKRSFKEERELEAIPGKIEALEAEQSQIHEQMADPNFYKTAGANAQAVSQRLQTIESELETLLLRWDELESIGKSS